MAAARRGAGRDVLVADASRRTTALNAYVSGLGPTRRIVVYDTLLRDAPPAEVEAVVAHELGHAKHGDVLTGTADRRARRGGRRSCGAVPARLVGRSAAPGRRRRRSPSRGRSGCCWRWPRWPGWSPGRCRTDVSRRIEARADAHALDAHPRSVHCGAMEQRLASTNLADLGPAAAGVPAVRHPSVHAWSGSRPPGPTARGEPVTTLLVTNDFPPRPGGIQPFVHNLAVRQPAGLGGRLRLDLGRARPSSTPSSRSRWSGEDTSVLLPTPAVARAGGRDRPRARLRLGAGSAPPRRSGCSPPACEERTGIRRAVALTHGHEAGWAALPGARPLLRRIGRRHRRGHLPRRVHPQPARPGARPD